MRRKRRKKLSSRAIFGAVILILIIIIFIISMLSIENSVKTVAVMQAENFSKATSNKVISSAVSEYLEENQYKYSDFAAVLYNETGKTVSIEAITYNINKVQSELTKKINEKLEKNGENSSEIRIGSLMSSYLLAGKGPHINIRICPIGEATVKLTSSFDSAGINQTCHRISAVITARMNSSIPLYSFETENNFDFLLAENIIVGEVPEQTINTWSEIF